MNAPAQPSPRRRRLAILSILFAAVVALVALTPEPQDAFPITLETITTNDLGHAEYSFRVENRAWDCYMYSANVRTLRADGIWTREDHLPKSHLRYTRITKGEQAVFRITSPTNAWRVRFGFYRTNVPKWRQRIQSTGYRLFGNLPRFAQVQHFIAADIIHINPTSPPQLSPPEARSGTKPTPIITLRTRYEWHKELYRTNRTAKSKSVE